jgi:acetyl/propionyl-CoA carboxylase alpha subunit
MKFYYQIGQEIKTVTIEQKDGQFHVLVNDQSYQIGETQLTQGQLNFKLEERRLRAYVARRGLERHIATGGNTWILEKLTRPKSRRGGADTHSGSLEAGMPGLVRQVLVSEGDQVERGQALALLEAMKMELKITAPFAGTVRRINCAPGQVVERGQVLVELEAVGD